MQEILQSCSCRTTFVFDVSICPLSSIRTMWTMPSTFMPWITCGIQRAKASVSLFLYNTGLQLQSWSIIVLQRWHLKNCWSIKQLLNIRSQELKLDASAFEHTVNRKITKRQEVKNIFFVVCRCCLLDSSWSGFPVWLHQACLHDHIQWLWEQPSERSGSEPAVHCQTGGHRCRLGWQVTKHNYGFMF